LNRILKGIQFYDRNKYKFDDPEGIIRIKDCELEEIVKNLEKDTQFLDELEIMDYSLFLVVEHLKEPLPLP